MPRIVALVIAVFAVFFLPRAEAQAMPCFDTTLAALDAITVQGEPVLLDCGSCNRGGYCFDYLQSCPAAGDPNATIGVRVIVNFRGPVCSVAGLDPLQNCPLPDPPNGAFAYSSRQTLRPERQALHGLCRDLKRALR